MKIKNLLLGIGLILTIAGCSKKDLSEPSVTPPTDTTKTPPVNPPPAPAPYSITEDFEQGTKTAYAAADVTLSTGSWNFNDAVIGNLAADLKDGLKSVRLRAGDIAMNFDINGLTTLYIKHGKYTGADKPSAWQLLMSADGGKTYTQVGSDINETNTTLVTDSFKVSTTGKVRFEIKKVGTTTDRINIDDITFKGTGDPGIVVGTPDDGSGDGDSDSGNPSGSAPRDVTAGADAPPASGDNSNLLFGNPSNAQNNIASSDNYLIDQKYYTESYNATKGEPNWVSWHLDATNTTNASPRGDDFAGWAGLPSSMYMVVTANYTNSGFDRGHNCPSADRTSSTGANDATFLMTNIIPQAPNNNEHTWANMENYLREQVVEGNEIYIIMGSYGTGGTGKNGAANTIDNGHINVPSNVWKVAVIIPAGNGDLSRVTASTRVIAVNTPNVNNINSDWTKYIVTVKDIETATGYTLLSSLPANVRAALEVKLDAGIPGA
ncbi:DNA/RNA non-specific endonuclease [Mucilaginibacter sabulilitoris]|uniref:DNA/RNA non-specific endonuclease n=1 Tax=Mucilaginibacter sabulilitoris TaxID=1173583 RepID=A0ABZ0TIL7_9SPHI|nr:DNA/RNA non-specific endonuclease [Mucilaginibacter sabulilitoris]WPU92018.1 DNA/RNA non-specific endonuclease [Mucilaginibacter sabulilitoris]